MPESRDEAFSKTEDYRGGNANMHAVEAFLIVYDVTHDKNGWIALSESHQSLFMM